MKLDKRLCFEKAVEITKEYARSGSAKRDIHLTLQEIYEMLKKIRTDVEAE